MGKRKDNPTAIGFIYLIRNTVNGKGYVGQHAGKCIEDRWIDHIRAARGASIFPIHRALRKHGADNFTIEEVWRGPVAELNAVEVIFVAKLGTFIDDGHGYNLTRGGGQNTQFSLSSRKLMKEAQQLRWSSGRAREEQRKLLLARYADGSLGAKVGEALKAKHAADPKLRHRCARPRSEQQKLAAGEWFKKHWADESRRKKHIESMRNRVPLTPEQREARSAQAKAQWANKDKRDKLMRGLGSVKPRSEETIKILSSVATNRWADPKFRALWMKRRWGITVPNEKGTS